MTEDLLSQLNDSQREAVEYCDGASLVIASAGSGKTRVLTYKIAYLLSDKGMKPWNILALTFTNKAAKEMKERIGLLVGQEVAAYLHMGTFHSVFSRILRAEASTLGYNSNFTIYDHLFPFKYSPSNINSPFSYSLPFPFLNPFKYSPSNINLPFS